MKFDLVLLAFVSMVMMISFVQAQPSFILGSSDQGLDIFPTVDGAIPINQNYTVAIHVNNASSGHPITSGISCYGHLYDGGEHLAEEEDTTVAHLFDYEFVFDQGNFSKKGEFILKTSCNDSSVGGIDEVYFYVTTYGDEPAGDVFKVFIYIIFIVVLLGAFFYLFMSILNMVTATQTIFGVVSAWSFYLGLILTNYLAKAYLLDYFIENITENVITWGGFPLILIPVFSLIITMVKKGFDKKNPINPQELTGRQFMRYG